jgi:hypothetical protein
VLGTKYLVDTGVGDEGCHVYLVDTGVGDEGFPQEPIVYPVRCGLWWDLVGSFGACFLEALVEGLAALEAGFYGVPVVDFCFT